MHSNELFWSSSSWEHAWPILNMHGSKIELSNRYFNALMWPFKRFHTKTQLITFCQSILLGWSIFWLARRKSETGPGLTIIVVETSADFEEKKRKKLTWAWKIKCKIDNKQSGSMVLVLDEYIPMFRESTLCATKAWMKSTTTHHTTTQLNKVWRVVMEKWLPDYKTAPANSEKNWSQKL